MIAEFWWGKQNESRKIHWRKWSVLTRSKEDSGLGFKELETFNVALLTKMVDRLIKESDALWACVLKGLYFPRSELHSARKIGKASWVGKALSTGETCWFEKAFGRWGTVRALTAPYIYTKAGFKLTQTPNLQVIPTMTVIDLIAPHHKWDVNMHREIAEPADVNNILQIPTPPQGQPDRLLWPYIEHSKKNC